MEQHARWPCQSLASLTLGRGKAQNTHCHAAANNVKPLQDDAPKEFEEGAESEGFISVKFVLQARPLLLTAADGEAAKSRRGMFSHTQPMSRARAKGYQS